MMMKLFSLVTLSLIVCGNAEDVEEKDETYEETRVKLCELLKTNGMKDKFDNCYDKFAPKEIKDMDAQCAELIGIKKLESYKELTSRFCASTGSKDFEKFETCTDDKAEKQNIDEKKEEEMLKPVLECIYGNKSSK